MFNILIILMFINVGFGLNIHGATLKCSCIGHITCASMGFQVNEFNTFVCCKTKYRFNKLKLL